VRLITLGLVMSLTVKLVVSVLLTFPEVSLAMIVTLYTPGASVNEGTKVKLKISPAKFVMVNIIFDPSARVIFASTVSTPIISVTLAVMLVLCVWLILSGTAVTLMTSGTTWSTAVKKVFSVSFKLPLVSLAKKLMLYCPNSAGIVKELLNLMPVARVRVICCTVVLGKVIFASTVSTSMLSVTFAAISMVVVLSVVVALLALLLLLLLVV